MTSPLQMNIGAARWLATLNLDSQERTQEQEQHTGLDAATPSPTNERLNRAFAALFAQLQAQQLKDPREHHANLFEWLNMALRARQHHRVKQADHVKHLLKQSVGDSGNPFQDIIDKLNGAMNQEDGNLSAYEKVIEKVMQILQALSAFMTEVGQHVRSSSDGKSIEVDLWTLYQDFWNQLPSGAIGKLPGDPNQWRQELAPFIPALLNVGDDGSISINYGGDSLLGKMHDNLYQTYCDWDGGAGGGPSVANPAAYQAWWAGFQGMESQIENMGQTIAEKYSHRNSNFDNLIKIISSTVQSMVDTSKQFLQI